MGQQREIGCQKKIVADLNENARAISAGNGVEIFPLSVKRINEIGCLRWIEKNK